MIIKCIQDAEMVCKNLKDSLSTHAGEHVPLITALIISTSLKTYTATIDTPDAATATSTTTTATILDADTHADNETTSQGVSEFPVLHQQTK